MSAHRPVLSGIDWMNVIPPLRGAQGVASALRVRILLLSLGGLGVFIGIDAAIDSLSTDQAKDRVIADATDRSPGNIATMTGDRIWKFGSQVALPFYRIASGTGSITDAVRCLWRLVALPLLLLALMRASSLGLTRSESPNVRKTLRFTASRAPSLLKAVALLTIGLVVALLPLLFTRLAMQVSWLAWPVALLWPVVMVSAVLLLLVAAAVVFGWPLTCGTLAIESTDSFDAVSRTYAYFYQRPLLMVATAGVAASAVGVGMLVAEYLTMALLSLLSFAQAQSSAAPIGFWQSVVLQLPIAFALAGIAGGSAATYLVLRRSIDGVEFHDIWVEPAERGLPDLSTKRDDSEKGSAEGEAAELARAG